jgi:hypothetical protein
MYQYRKSGYSVGYPVFELAKYQYPIIRILQGQSHEKVGERRKAM